MQQRRFSRRQAEKKLNESAAEGFREAGREDMARKLEREADEAIIDVFREG